MTRGQSADVYINLTSTFSTRAGEHEAYTLFVIAIFRQHDGPLDIGQLVYLFTSVTPDI
jgi:hypothetical protein